MKCSILNHPIFGPVETIGNLYKQNLATLETIGNHWKLIGIYLRAAAPAADPGKNKATIFVAQIWSSQRAE